MKRLLAVTLLTGCSNEAEPTVAPTADAAILPARETMANPGFFDMDPTGMNTTMVYSCVFSVVNDPAEYVGQRIKIKGVYQTSYGAPRKPPATSWWRWTPRRAAPRAARSN